MDEDGQWRQLGSVVSKVMANARVKAMRSGRISRIRPPNKSPASKTILALGHSNLSGHVVKEDGLQAVQPTPTSQPAMAEGGLALQLGEVRKD